MLQPGQSREILSFYGRRPKSVAVDVQLNRARCDSGRDGLETAPRAVDDVAERITEARVWTRPYGTCQYCQQCVGQNRQPRRGDDNVETRVGRCQHDASCSDSRTTVRRVTKML